jgi:hypothetical protein
MKRAQNRAILFVTLSTLVLALALPKPIRGQRGEGVIVGLVTDNAGAAIPGASVTAHHVDTGLARATVTDSNGNFEILALPIGKYEVKVEKSGFKQTLQRGLVVEVGRRLRWEPVLEVGQVQEQVTIQATTLIQTETAAIGTTVEQKQITELPLNGRNYVQLAEIAPGVRLTRTGTYSRIQGNGVRDNQTEFVLDGLNNNAPVNEDGMLSPSVDTIGEFRVETGNFSAEYGRQPMVVNAAIKSGTNSLHFSLWEFVRNDFFDAANAFSPVIPNTTKRQKPTLRQNQFGFTAGGPILKDRTFLFGSWERTMIRQQAIYNSTVVSPAMKRGDFSALSRAIRDPLTGLAFPGNVIPPTRINPASAFFLPYVLEPNSADGRFRFNASRPSDTNNYMLRADHQLTTNQRLYGHYGIADIRSDVPGYDPIRGLGFATSDARSQHVAVNYSYAITPTTLFTASGGYLSAVTSSQSPNVGKENFVEQAGIQGIPTAGREKFIGLPAVGFAGYTGFNAEGGFSAPRRTWGTAFSGQAGLSLIRGNHSIAIGWQGQDRTTFGNHGSCCSRGSWFFNGQYTGDGFADYLLGYIASAQRNTPLNQFGQLHSPYTALYVQDYWKVSPNVTLNLGLRYDYWHAKKFFNGARAAWDSQNGRILAGTLDNGEIDLDAQGTTRALVQQYGDLVVRATDAGLPPGLWNPDKDNLAPRVGITWRPFGGTDFVVRGGYGVFYSLWGGNTDASAIVGPPYWAIESLGFSPTQPTDWRFIWPNEPSFFVTPGVTGVDPNTKAQINHEWNLSVQKQLPFGTGIELSYVGNSGGNLQLLQFFNEVSPGRYSNLQAARPFPRLGRLANQVPVGKSWYHGLQAKVERRFAKGLSYGLAYAFSRTIDFGGTDFLNSFLTPFAPEGYDRGLSDLHRKHVLTLNWVYELPFGRGRTFAGDLPSGVDAVVGGWQVSGIYRYRSGSPLSVSASGAPLGNGFATRADLVGDLSVPNQSAALWFNPQAFAQPTQFTFGNSGKGILIGPPVRVVDLVLAKNFRFGEARSLQVRWEMFNALNHVNLGNPVTTIGTTQTGRIFSAGDARIMQFGLKFNY